MTIHDELGQTRRALQNLEKALAGLRNQLGPHLDVLRLIDDVSRCSTDLRRLEEQVGPSPTTVCGARATSTTRGSAHQAAGPPEAVRPSRGTVSAAA